jgi:Na+-translocating ferredoxin:NAD+ oxidoreductase subunit A
MEYIIIIIAAVFVNNIVLAQFLGICPFIGVSSKVKTSVGMGGAVLFVLVLAGLVTWLIRNYILLPLDIEFMSTIAYILIIASLVQMVEIILKKISPALFQALGVFLPLITTNCAILGVAILIGQNEFNLMQALVFAIGHSIGFFVAIVIFAGLREHLEKLALPPGVRGVPAALIVAGILALAFMGFAGIV